MKIHHTTKPIILSSIKKNVSPVVANGYILSLTPGDIVQVHR